MKDFVIGSVKDELTGTFLQPIFGESVEEITRVFKHNINSIPIWRTNPSDFSLYVLGRFNDNTGVLTPAIQKIVSGSSVVERKEESNDDIWNQQYPKEDTNTSRK